MLIENIKVLYLQLHYPLMVLVLLLQAAIRRYKYGTSLMPINFILI